AESQAAHDSLIVVAARAQFLDDDLSDRFQLAILDGQHALAGVRPSLRLADMAERAGRDGQHPEDLRRGVLYAGPLPVRPDAAGARDARRKRHQGPFRDGEDFDFGIVLDAVAPGRIVGVGSDQKVRFAFQDEAEADVAHRLHPQFGPHIAVIRRVGARHGRQRRTLPQDFDAGGRDDGWFGQQQAQRRLRTQPGDQLAPQGVQELFLNDVGFQQKRLLRLQIGLSPSTIGRYAKRDAKSSEEASDASADYRRDRVSVLGAGRGGGSGRAGSNDSNAGAASRRGSVYRSPPEGGQT